MARHQGRRGEVLLYIPGSNKNSGRTRAASSRERMVKKNWQFNAICQKAVFQNTRYQDDGKRYERIFYSGSCKLAPDRDDTYDAKLLISRLIMNKIEDSNDVFTTKPNSLPTGLSSLNTTPLT